MLTVAAVAHAQRVALLFSAGRRVEGALDEWCEEKGALYGKAT